jgi:indole-3-glycerol phosphate synthase
MILDEILARTRVDLAERKLRTPIAALEAEVRARPPARSLWAALRQPGRLTAIAEFKRRSPSAGWIGEGADVAEVVPSYLAGGAAGLSILTDGPFFGGALADLARARALVGESALRPAVLRKDFVVDEYQLAEARAAGADAVLLIAASLDDRALRALFASCATWGLEALVETHDPVEAERAVAIGATVIGVNHRDLRTFEVDMELAVGLRARIPPDRVVVAESGIRTAADVRRMADAKIDAILVGESLMRAPDRAAALRALLDGGR